MSTLSESQCHIRARVFVSMESECHFVTYLLGALYLPEMNVFVSYT